MEMEIEILSAPYWNLGGIKNLYVKTGLNLPQITNTLDPALLYNIHKDDICILDVLKIDFLIYLPTRYMARIQSHPGMSSFFVGTLGEYCLLITSASINSWRLLMQRYPTWKNPIAEKIKMLGY